MSYLFSYALKNGVWDEALPSCFVKHKVKRNRALARLWVLNDS